MERRRVDNGFEILEFNKAMITDNRLTASATEPDDRWVTFYWSMDAAWVQWTADGRTGVFPRLQHCPKTSPASTARASSHR